CRSSKHASGGAMSARASAITATDLGDVLDYVPQAVVVLDVQGTETTAQYANPAFTELTGFGFEALSRGPIWRLLAGADSDVLVQQQLRTALANAQAFSHEWLIYRRDGTPVWVRVSARPTARAGRVA